MELTQLILLAIVQGITEFLPISSSGHLILASRFFGMPDQGVLIDVALHFGSLFAVLVYFWRDVRDAVLGPFTLVGDITQKRPLSWSSKLSLLLVVATIPVIIAGLFLYNMDFYDELRDKGSLVAVKVIGWTTLVYGVILYIADRFSPFDRELKDWGWASATIMGLSQALSLIPGTSRSGICMTTARFLGFDRRESARIAMLMAIPTILAASALGMKELIETGDTTLTMDAVIAAVLSFVSAYGALALMMRWLGNATFTPFVVYRIILGGFLLWTAYSTV